MEDIFITELKINKVRHLENITIPLSKKERKHLIITGKNGSGKTSMLDELRKYLQAFLTALRYKNNNDSDLPSNPQYYLNEYSKNAGVTFNIPCPITDLLQIIDIQEFILTYFPAKRGFKPEIPDVIEKIDFPIETDLKTKLNEIFLKYLVKLEFDRLYWHKNQNTIITNQIDNWFSRFISLLQEIFGDETLELKFDIDSYNYQILTQDREPFDFNTMADGYSAILDIVTEIMLRMENSKSQLFDIQGIVIIDEIEAHLHIELQEKILPFLTRIFPKIQFIVSTHSPFILNSIDDVVIYDLENHIRLEDVSDVSFQGLVKNYFKITSEYSSILENKITDYEQLMNKFENLTPEETERLGELDIELDNLSPLLAPDMFLRFKQAQKNIFAEKND
jgi:predicted ATPase